MKEIKAIIRPHRLEAVIEELYAHPALPGMTISTVQGFGKTVDRDPRPEGKAAKYGTVEMVKLECIVDDEMLDEILEVIKTSALTGLPGDGKIIVYEVQEIVKIKSGDRGDRIA